MKTFNKRQIQMITALLTATMLLVVMCLSNASIVSSASWFTYTTPPRNELLVLAGYSAAVTDFNPLQYDSGSMGFDVGIMYEPLFGQNLATGAQINWLGKNISWINSTAIDVVLRSDIYWVNLTTSGPVYYRPITAQDVNYTFWLYGAYNSSDTWCNYMNGLRDRLENNGTNNDLNSFVILSNHEFVIRLNPIFANSDVAFRAITKNILILPWDVWTQIMSDTKDGYAAAPLSFANDWTGAAQAMPQAWMVASGMYLSWYHDTVSSDTIMQRNPIWWGANDTDFGRLPMPQYLENYFFAGNAFIPSAVESGDIDWDGNYIAGLQDIMTTSPNVHTYFWNLPYFPDGSALCIVPNHREYPVGEPWLAKAIAECINYTAISAVDSYYLRTPSVLLLPVDDALARLLVNTTIESEYQPTYNATDALAILNQYCFKGDGTKGSVNGQWYTKDGPSAAELALYPEYSSGDSKVVNALPNWGDGKVHVAIPTVGVGSAVWNLINIQGWTDVNAADAIVCYQVQHILGVNLVSDLLGPPGWSPEYIDRMNYVYGNASFDFADFCMEGALDNNMFERYTQFFTSLTGPEGETAHYGSYRNPTLTALIYSLDTVPAGSQAQKSIANQIEQIVGSNMPIIAEGGHPNWYIYSDKYWIGFADQYSNPLLECGPYVGRANIADLQLGIWRLHPKNFDLNGDGKVDIKDVAIVASAFGTVPGSARWNTVADIYDGRQINIKDLSAIAKAFGTTYVYP